MDKEINLQRWIGRLEQREMDLRLRGPGLSIKQPLLRLGLWAVQQGLRGMVPESRAFALRRLRGRLFGLPALRAKSLEKIATSGRFFPAMHRDLMRRVLDRRTLRQTVKDPGLMDLGVAWMRCHHFGIEVELSIDEPWPALVPLPSFDDERWLDPDSELWKDCRCWVADTGKQAGRLQASSFARFFSDFYRHSKGLSA